MNEKRTNEEYLVNAELQALKYIIQYPSQIHNFLPSMFIHKTAKVIYEVIETIINTKASLDAQNIMMLANEKNEAINQNTFQYIVNPLFHKEEDGLREEDKALLLPILNRAKTKFEAANKLQTLYEKLQSTEVPDDDFFSEVSKSLLEVQSTITAEHHTKVLHITEALDLQKDILNARQTQSSNLCGDILLDKHLTRKTAGGQIILIAGATGSGKSAYVLDLANGLINIDEPGLMFTLEMDTESTMDRLLAKRTGIPVEDWYDKDKIVNLIPKLEKERKILESCKFHITDDPSLSLADIHAHTQEFRMRYNIPLTTRIIVFIDLITQLKDFASSGNKGYSMANNYELAVNALNVYAKMDNVCVIAVAQFNRNADSFTIESVADVMKCRPSLNDVKNSAALAERSRVVLSAFRPKYYLERYLPDNEATELAEDILELTILKQSQGVVGTRMNYLFHGPTLTCTPTDSSLLEGLEGEEESSQDLLNQVHF